MNNKKVLTLITAALSLSMLASCSGNETVESDTSAETAHIHSAHTLWEVTPAEHWHLCEDCGEKMDVQEHTLNEDSLCTVCNAEIWHYDDNTCDISIRDEHGSTIRNTVYNEDGSVLYDTRYEIEYDENGNPVHEKEYYNGSLSGESQYALNADGEIYTVYYKSFDENGGTSLHEYDELGDLSHTEFYDAAGNKTFEEFIEYAIDKNNVRYTAKVTEHDYASSKMYISEFNSYGDQTGRTICALDGTVERADRFELGYDEDGNRSWRKEYLNDVLVEEVLNYKTISSEDCYMSFPENVIKYFEDGTKILSYYNADANLETETTYNADGTVASVRSYTYGILELEYYEEYYVSSIAEYDADGVLIREEKFDADGNTVEAE